MSGRPAWSAPGNGPRVPELGDGEGARARGGGPSAGTGRNGWPNRLGCRVLPVLALDL